MGGSQESIVQIYLWQYAQGIVPLFNVPALFHEYNFPSRVTRLNKMYVSISLNISWRDEYDLNFLPQIDCGCGSGLIISVHKQYKSG